LRNEVPKDVTEQTSINSDIQHIINHLMTIGSRLGLLAC